MLSILSKIFTFLFISSLSVGFSALKNKTKIHNSFFETCGEGEIIDDIEKENNNEQEQSPFSGTSQTIYLNTQVSSYYSTPYTVYYNYTPSRRAFTKLNYSGAYAHLTIYYFDYYSSNDYVTYVEDVGSHLDCYYFDCEIKYLFEFTMYQPTYNGTLYSFILTEMNVNTTNKDKYILHQTFAYSTIGYRYEVEYFDVSQTSSTMVDSVLVNNATYTNYDDVISSTLNFNVNNDNRRVVVNTEFEEYSAIAYLSESIDYYDGGLDDEARGSAAFITDNIALSCAHMIYFGRRDNSINEVYRTNLPYQINLSPGVSSYNTGSPNNSIFGAYKAVETYSPISYVIAFNDAATIMNPYGSYSDDCVPYDWSIIVTNCTTSGTKTHSTMGYNNFTSGVSQYPYARVAGYPKIKNCPSTLANKYSIVQWTNSPLEGSVSISGNTLVSTNRITSTGNSGGPMYVKLTTITNGQVHTTVSIIGICSGGNNSQSEFYFCRMRHQIINIIAEVLNNA